MPSTVQTLKDAAPDALNNDLSHNKIALTHANNMTGDLNHIPADRPYTTTLGTVPVTLERRLYVPQPHDRLIDPGVARANLAVSNECPDGTPGWREEHAHQTVLQQHCSHWDPDHDGIVYPWDIYHGCAAWGWNPILCTLVSVVISSALSYFTLPSGTLLPDPCFRIYLSGIHKARHGSDSNTFDNEGRFRPQQFEDIFAQYDEGNKGGMDRDDLTRAWKGHRIAADPFGSTGGMLEWFALYLLVWPEDGIIKKEDIRAAYDGSLFQRKADEYAAKQDTKRRS